MAHETLPITSVTPDSMVFQSGYAIFSDNRSFPDLYPKWQSVQIDNRLRSPLMQMSLIYLGSMDS